MMRARTDRSGGSDGGGALLVVVVALVVASAAAVLVLVLVLVAAAAVVVVVGLLVGALVLVPVVVLSPEPLRAATGASFKDVAVDTAAVLTTRWEADGAVGLAVPFGLPTSVFGVGCFSANALMHAAMKSARLISSAIVGAAAGVVKALPPRCGSSGFAKSYMRCDVCLTAPRLDATEAG